ncbi:MAG TPA: hypothetical protein VN455_07930 [Methanotrichaceae archaeon]|nr:hypothetical protein [Methanotrichaceae archaeon]
MILEHEGGAKAIDPRAQELEITKEILAEIFGAPVPEVQEMIRQRLLEC